MSARRRVWPPLWLLALAAVVAAPSSGCSKATASSSAADAGGDAAPADAGTPACSVPADGGTPAGVADDFGPNATAGSSSSALGQLNVYEVTSPRRLEWVDLYLRASLAGTRLTIAVFEAATRNAAFQRTATVSVDVPPCVGWIGTGPLGVALEPGRFYAIGYDPNQAVTSFVDSESNDLPIDGQFGRLIGSETSTSVSLDTLDWGKPSSSSFTRQRLFTSPRAATQEGGDGGVSDGAADAAADVARDASGAADAGGQDAGVLDARG